MKRLIDVVCPSCGHEQLDVWVDLKNFPLCPNRLDAGEPGDMPMYCAGQMVRLWKTRAGAVKQDEIPGGIDMPNGICNDDGSPKRYYSWSDIRRAAKEKGLTNLVEHVVDPTSGSDKNPHTTRWDATPAYVVDPAAEAERVRHWHLHEATVR